MKGWKEIVMEGKKPNKKEMQKAFDEAMKGYKDDEAGREECYEALASKFDVTVDYVKSKAW